MKATEKIIVNAFGFAFALIGIVMLFGECESLTALIATKVIAIPSLIAAHKLFTLNDKDA